MNAHSLMNKLLADGIELGCEEGSLLINANGKDLSADMVEKIKAHKEEIIELLESLKKSEGERQALTRVNRAKCYICETSSAEKRMLFMEEVAQGEGDYNIPVAYEIKGNLNVDALIDSFRLLLSRHDILRSRYDQADISHAKRMVEDESGFILNRVELSAQMDSAQLDSEEVLKNTLREEADYRFRLTDEWPIRVTLISLNETHHVLSINIHHIAADGWSAEAIVSEINQAYSLYSGDTETRVLQSESKPFQYADYVEWEKQWLESESFAEARQYWHSQLKGLPAVHSLPLDYNRGGQSSIRGSRFKNTLPKNLSKQVKRCARHFKTTPFVVIQAAFSALISRYSSESDVVFGTAVANRFPSEFVSTVGMFVNTLVLRHSVSEDMTFSELVSHAVDVNNNAMRYESYPFDLLVDELQPKRSLSHNPLVQIMLVMQEEKSNNLDLEGLSVTPIDNHQTISKFDLTAHTHIGADQIGLDWEFNAELFSIETIEKMAQSLQTYLTMCVEFGGLSVGETTLVDIEKNASQLKADTFLPAECIHTVFENYVEKTPNALAVIGNDGNLSYAELNHKATVLARHIQRNVGRYSRVGVCLDKSAELVISMLAVFKAGCVYVPLDPYYPVERQQYMREDSRMSLLITSQDLKEIQLDRIKESDNADLICHSIEELLETPIEDETLNEGSIDDPAYIIYTSGSTGKPKGVLVSHKSLYYSLHANKRVMNFCETDQIPTIGSQVFGVSLLEILLPLISGGATLALNKDNSKDLDKLIESTKDVTVLHAVPSLMRHWLDRVKTGCDDIYPNLRLLLVGGEPVPEELLRDIRIWRPEVRLRVLYGMTESAVVCSSHEIENEWEIGYSIGKPHPNSFFRVLNEKGKQQPVGVPGELHVGGLSLASEYVNRVELTAEKFTSYEDAPEERLYKTGDRVRELKNGYYEFLGRVDNQVSLRGVRIELGEIESLALSTQGVSQVVASLFEPAQGEQILALYFTTEAEVVEPSEVAQTLARIFKRKLPEYMRPSVVTCLSEMPLNPNGKIDRKKLPAPQLHSEKVEPATELEEKVLSSWRSVLKNEEIGVTDNFFEVGGHSLLAVRLASTIRDEFGIEFQLATLFESATVRECCVLIEEKLKDKYAEKMIDHEPSSEEAFEELVI